MKRRLSFLLFISILFFLSGLNAQPGSLGNPLTPYQLNGSPLFGKDIIINDHPTQDQYKVALCSAFNGWEYAAIAYQGPQVYFTLLKSVDRGITWTIITDGWVIGPDQELSSMDILVSGDSVSNLKIIYSTVSVTKNEPSLIGTGTVNVFNEGSGSWEYQLLLVNSCYDIALASDYLYPAVNSNPHSVGILYSIYRPYGDSILFSSSSNGGLTLDGYKGVAGTATNHFHKVALSYGRSPSWSSGRYFAVWEERNGFGLIPGHINTSHSNPNFNSSFTKPVCLDSLDPALINKTRNPSIACQYSNFDNDSSNLTEVVLFDKSNPSGQAYDIAGYYNLQATDHKNFRKLNFSNSAHYNTQPSINFNPFDSTFMVTYYDSTNQKLPFLTNNFNLRNPDAWQFITNGYNDSANLAAPNPKVALDVGQQKGINAWIAERASGNGIAMFDASYSVYTDIFDNMNKLETINYGAYPNPCSNIVTIWFEFQFQEILTVTIKDISQHIVKTNICQDYPAGRGIIKFDVSTLPSGCYYYTLSSNRFSVCKKLIIIK
jgi:hypothetical protein